jgi:PHD/YefM family antitoxin component YafN of YafNO toxin-antitoxin module
MIFIKAIKFIGPSGYLIKSITLSELRLKAKQTIREIEETRKEVIITKNGKPIFLM